MQTKVLAVAALVVAFAALAVAEVPMPPKVPGVVDADAPTATPNETTLVPLPINITINHHYDGGVAPYGILMIIVGVMILGVAGMIAYLKLKPQDEDYYNPM